MEKPLGSVSRTASHQGKTKPPPSRRKARVPRATVAVTRVAPMGVEPVPHDFQLYAPGFRVLTRARMPRDSAKFVLVGDGWF